MGKAFIVSLLLSLISCQDLWAQQAYSHKGLGYQIDFPAKPAISSQTKPSNVGDLTMKIIGYEPNDSLHDENYLYMVTESKYPDSTIHSGKVDMLDNFFRNAIDGAIMDVGGVLLKETKGNIGIYPTRTIEIDYGSGKAIIKMKVLLKESRIIMIQTITAPASYPNDAGDAFFRSFKLG